MELNVPWQLPFGRQLKRNTPEPTVSDCLFGGKCWDIWPGAFYGPPSRSGSAGLRCTVGGDVGGETLGPSQPPWPPPAERLAGRYWVQDRTGKAAPGTRWDMGPPGHCNILTPEPAWVGQWLKEGQTQAIILPNPKPPPPAPPTNWQCGRELLRPQQR